MPNLNEFPHNLGQIFATDDKPLRWKCYDHPTLHRVIYASLPHQPPPTLVDWVIEKIEEDEDCYTILKVWLGNYKRELEAKKAARDKQFGDLFKRLVEANELSNNKLGEVLEGGHRTARKWRNGDLEPEPTRPQLISLQKVGLGTADVNELLAILDQPPLTAEEIWHSDIEVIDSVVPVKVFNVPDKRSRQFVGREQQLLALRDGFTGKQPSQVISGLGGIGKTELAIQYAHRYRDDYQVVWWVHADEANQLITEFNKLTTPLGQPGEKIDDPKVVKGIVMRWLAEHNKWLLIFDNADQPELLKPYLSELNHQQKGHVLITSRAHDFGRFAQTLPIGLFSPAEALTFLHLTRPHETDDAALTELAETLGYLPLALDQAVAYLQATGESVRGYVAMFQRYQRDLLAEAPSMFDNRTIATVWNISLARLAEKTPQTLELLRLCAFLAPDDIPITLLSEGADSLPPALGPIHFC
jgi:hypothetical protein